VTQHVSLTHPCSVKVGLPSHKRARQRPHQVRVGAVVGGDIAAQGRRQLCRVEGTAGDDKLALIRACCGRAGVAKDLCVEIKEFDGVKAAGLCGAGSEDDGALGEVKPGDAIERVGVAGDNVGTKLGFGVLFGV
jgi:hypothetical protein